MSNASPPLNVHLIRLNVRYQATQPSHTGRLMPFTYSLQSAIDRGLRRTGLGHNRPFDIDP
jgi:hypothetical protein